MDFEEEDLIRNIAILEHAFSLIRMTKKGQHIQHYLHHMV